MILGRRSKESRTSGKNSSGLEEYWGGVTWRNTSWHGQRRVTKKEGRMRTKRREVTKGRWRWTNGSFKDCQNKSKPWWGEMKRHSLRSWRRGYSNTGGHPLSEKVTFVKVNNKRADNEASQRAFWAKIRRMMPKYALRRQQMRASKIEQLRGKWAPHLCAMEAGEVVQMEDLYMECITRQNQAKRETHTLKLVPSLCDVEEVLRRMRPDKTGGPEGLDPSWMAKGAEAIAPAVFDLWMKTVLWGSEPLQFKGGLLTMLPKGNGRHDPSQFRGVMMGPCLSKGLHAHIRKPLMEGLSRVRPPGQIGGFPGKECSFGAQYIRVLTTIGQKLKISSAVIYVDLKTAFHSLIRQLVVGHMDDAANEWKIAQECLEKEGGSKGVEEWLKEGGCLKRMGVDQEVIRMMSELSTNAWSFVDETTVRTTRGSRPGSPVADATFHSTMLDICWQVTRLVEEGQEEMTQLRDKGVQIQPIVWADDLAVPIMSLEAEDLRGKVEYALEKINQAFTSRGFVLNMGSGKTEVIPTWVGQGAPEERRRVLMEEDPHFTMKEKGKGEKKVRIQAKYKHLGAVQETGGGMDSEIKARTTAAWTAFRQMSRGLLCCRKYKMKTRLAQLESLVFSKLFYGAGSWPLLTSKQEGSMRKAYTQMIRQVVGLQFRKLAKTMSDAHVLEKGGKRSLQIRLTTERLRYASRFYRNGEDFMIRAAEAEAELHEGAWRRQLQKDWTWIRSIQGSKWGDSIEETVRHWQEGRGGWKNFVEAAAEKHGIQEEIARKVRRKEEREEEKEGKEMEEEAEGIRCRCGKGFKDKRAWAMHATVVHQRRTEVHKIQGTRCLVCMKELWTNPRLKQHMTYLDKGRKQNQCMKMAEHSGCFADGGEGDGKIPLPGLRRRERLRMTGPLVCGAERGDREYVDKERKEAKAELEAKLGIKCISEALQAMYFEDMEITYEQSGVEHLRGLLEFVGVKEEHRGVTYLFWGFSREWRSEKEQEEWKQDLKQMQEGEALLRWHQLETLHEVLREEEEEGENTSEADKIPRRKKERKDERSRLINDLRGEQLWNSGLDPHEAVQVRRAGTSIRFLKNILGRL